MKVLVIPEDFRKDQHLLRPIIEAMMKAAGKPKAKVQICRDPLLGGVDEALKWERIEEALLRHRGMAQLFLLCVDRDGQEGRRTALNSLESRANPALPHGRMFLAANAWQEIEVWVLAGHDLPSDWVWEEVRREIHPKEQYFHPFAAEKGTLDDPGNWQGRLAVQAASRYDRIRQLCPEDVGALERDIRAWLDGNTPERLCPPLRSVRRRPPE